MTQQPFFQKEKIITKDPLPHVDVVVTNLKSNVNFIKLNTKTAKIQHIRKEKQSVDYLRKKNFGKVPQYLNKIKTKIEKEEELIKHEVEEK